MPIVKVCLHVPSPSQSFSISGVFTLHETDKDTETDNDWFLLSSIHLLSVLLSMNRP